MTYFLAGDLGGTKTLLALYAITATGPAPLAGRRFASHDYGNLAAMVEAFLAGRPETVEAAAFGVAGPVVGDKARLTNLGWTIDRRELQARFGWREVALMNDLVAVANAVPDLAPSELVVVNEGRRDPRGAMAVLAPGTGLGEAYLCWDGSGYRPYPSEGGHTDFAPGSEEEMALLLFLGREMDHVSYEQVCSGRGIANLFRFLRDGKGMKVAAAAAAELGRADDLTPVIVAHGLAGRCPVCRKAIELFLDILAGEAGNLAVKFLATGGVYLGGGIPPRLLSIFDPGRFMQRFTGKGRMASLLADIPVSLIRGGDTALAGAARRAAELAGAAFCGEGAASR
ncbi:MAG: glucokinase [Desulfobulbaceae bacterium]|nr:glucokinase [Desulfobulbaceae bacterium]